MAKATLKTLTAAAEALAKAQGAAEQKLARRNAIAAELADAGVKYDDLAKAMGITPDGVTYVLRKVRATRKE